MTVRSDYSSGGGGGGDSLNMYPFNMAAPAEPVGYPMMDYRTGAGSGGADLTRCLMVSTRAGLTQEQIFALFDIIPGMEYCELQRDAYGMSKGGREIGSWPHPSCARAISQNSFVGGVSGTNPKYKFTASFLRSWRSTTPTIWQQRSTFAEMKLHHFASASRWAPGRPPLLGGLIGTELDREWRSFVDSRSHAEICGNNPVVKRDIFLMSNDVCLFFIWGVCRSRHDSLHQPGISTLRQRQTERIRVPTGKQTGCQFYGRRRRSQQVRPTRKTLNATKMADRRLLGGTMH